MYGSITQTKTQYATRRQTPGRDFPYPLRAYQVPELQQAPHPASGLSALRFLRRQRSGEAQAGEVEKIGIMYHVSRRAKHLIPDT